MTYACTLYWKTLRSLKWGKNIQAEKFYYPLRGGCFTSGWKTHTSWTGRQLTEVKPRVQSRKEVFCHTHMIKFKAFCFVSRGKNYIWEKKNKIHLCLFDWRSTEINLRVIRLFHMTSCRHIYQGRPKDLRWCAIGEIFKEISGAVVFQDQAVCGFKNFGKFQIPNQKINGECFYLDTLTWK